MARRNILCLLHLLIPTIAHAQGELEGVWQDATMAAKAWLDSGNSLPFPVAFSPESVEMSSVHLEEAHTRIASLVEDSKCDSGELIR
jgi:hypothetical protein